MTDYSHGFGFCPAKLFRDDPVFCDDARILYLAWRLGQVPSGGSLDTMSEDDAEIMMALIQNWSDIARAEDFRMLGRLLGGDGKEK